MYIIIFTGCDVVIAIILFMIISRVLCSRT